MYDHQNFVYTPTAERIARAMVASDAYLIDRDHWFTWKSGIKAPVYTDCRTLMGAPGARTMIKKALGSATLSKFGSPDYIVGVAEAGIHWSALVADELHCRHAFVRKEAKGHGIGGLVAGIRDDLTTHDGRTAVIVDDLVASGGSLVRAVDALRDEAHVEVLGVVSIVNWGFAAMRDAFRGMRLNPVSLVSYPELLAAALEDELVDERFCEELLRFYLNPRGHEWSPEFRMGTERNTRDEATAG